jgi:hypothetical protein
MTVVETFCQYVRPLMKARLSERNESVRWLSKTIDIDYHKLHRLDHGELKGMSFFDAEKLVKFLEPRSFFDILYRYYPAESARLNQEQKKSEPSVEEKAMQFILTHESRWEIFTYAKFGRSRAEVLSRFGSRGMEHVEELLKAEILIEVNGTVMSNLARELSFSEETAKREANMQIGFMSFERPGTVIRNDQLLLNFAGHHEVYNLTSKYIDMIYQIRQDPKYQGDRMAVLTVAVGPLANGEQNDTAK